jgi:hypothetical protein
MLILIIYDIYTQISYTNLIKKPNFMAGIADQFAGLPIEELIVSPIIGMAKGQAKLNEVTWKYISEVAFVKDEKTGKTSARSLDVEMNRVVTNGELENKKYKNCITKFQCYH